MACGEVEEVRNASINADPAAPQRYSAVEFAQVIEPLLAELSCDTCHGNPLGGFKWDTAGTPAASDSNQLNVQRAMDDAQPSASPMLVRLSLPKVDGHPRYYCTQSCLYQYLLAWGTESIGPVDYDAIECVEVPPEDIAAGECPEG